MRRKKGSNNSFPRFARHLFPRLSHPTHGTVLRFAALLLGMAGLALAGGAGRLTAEPGSDEQHNKASHDSEFLLFGTVFAQEGLALPGAEVRVRRAGERKARWEARSDRRGEFAVRVPRGAEYEMSVRATGYREQTRKVDAKSGRREDFVFRLERASGGKQK